MSVRLSKTQDLRTTRRINYPSVRTSNKSVTTSEQTEFRDGRKYKKQQNNFKKCICGATPNIPLRGVKCEFSVGSLSKHHSRTRRGPLRKISCHPFLKIFVNLVSSVCGFISTCINVSSLVTEAHYFTEDIIKNVWPPRTGIQGGVRGVGAGGVGWHGGGRRSDIISLFTSAAFRVARLRRTWRA